MDISEDSFNQPAGDGPVHAGTLYINQIRHGRPVMSVKPCGRQLPPVFKRNTGRTEALDNYCVMTPVTSRRGLEE
jgi:hypothetical protein